MDNGGNLFVNATDGIYRYTGGDPQTLERILEFTPPGSGGTLAFSPDFQTLYLVRLDLIYAVDPLSGASSILGRATVPGDEFTGGAGMALYVPEPGTAFLWMLNVGLLVGMGRVRRVA